MRKTIMSNLSARRAKNNRNYHINCSMIQFKVVALEADEDLMRCFAEHLIDGGPDVDRIKSTAYQNIGNYLPEKDRILKALRRLPFDEIDLNLSRPYSNGRKIDL